MQEIRAKQVLGYVMLPGILPRAKQLFGSGFGFLAFLMANIMQAVRLLPAQHPYTRPSNIGKFSIAGVFAQARSNLVFDRAHIDQILVFTTLLLGFIILVLQFLFLVLGMIIRPVLASGMWTAPANCSTGGGSIAGMFSTPCPTKDIAFVLMDKVFGVPGIFNSEYAPVNGPLPFHQALHSLFEFYSIALLLVAVIVVLYYIVVVVIETAQTGTPFGRRFNHIWAPLRLVVALGLLVPINYGLNSGQYIVLMTAKIGSGFATNGWLLFNQSMSNALGTDEGQLYSRVKVPDVWPIAKFMLLAATCEVAYKTLNPDMEIGAWLIKSGQEAQQLPLDDGLDNYDVMLAAYGDALSFYNKRDIVVRFGTKDPVKGSNEPGNIVPYCGEVVFHTIVTDDASYNIGPYEIQKDYFAGLLIEWPLALGFGNLIVHRYLPNSAGTYCNLDGAGQIDPERFGEFSSAACDLDGPGIPLNEVMEVRELIQFSFEERTAEARQKMVDSGALDMPEALLQRGWAGAGIWYNRIAEINGAFASAVSHIPEISLMPKPMQETMKANKESNPNVSMQDMFTPHLSDGSAVGPEDETTVVARALNSAYTLLGPDDRFVSSDQSSKGNVFFDALNMLFGLNGLWSMRENTDIHPLAQLAGLGKSIVDSSITSLFGATAFSLFSGMGIAGTAVAASVFQTVAIIGLSIGFILYYVLPFLPFMYFFFAVGSWLKTVFEAMVGVPLWALAHLRIDGNGLPGDSAMGGYYMILEIFLRPILTVFGLIGSLIIFSAMVKVLNEVFSVVTANLAGFDHNPCQLQDAGGDCTLGNSVSGTLGADPDNPITQQLLQFKRNVIDEFFFTIIYAVVVYMLATTSFKMIDLVPSQILRWIGSGERVFADSIQDSTQEMNRYVAYAGFTMTSQTAGAVTSVSGGAGRSLSAMLQRQQGSNVTGGQTP